MVQHKETNEYKILHEKNKGGKRMTISTDTEKEFDANEHHFLDLKKKNVNKTRNEKETLTT